MESNNPRGHVLATPRFFLGLRAFQLVVAIVILGMSAYGIHYVSYNGFCLSLFTVGKSAHLVQDVHY
jgi:hypothetical protein